MSCKYCLLDAKGADCISPCNCTGSSAFVHKSCLFSWISVKRQTPRWRCELCNSDIRYSFSRETFAPAVLECVKFFFLLLPGILVFCLRCQKTICQCRTLISVCRRVLASVVFASLAYALFFVFAAVATRFTGKHSTCFVYDVFAIAVETNAAGLLLEFVEVVPIPLYRTFIISLCVQIAHFFHDTSCGYRIFVDTAVVCSVICICGLLGAARVALIKYENTRMLAEIALAEKRTS
jgi:E3 ubiquitin-protein ligase DOA10